MKLLLDTLVWMSDFEGTVGLIRLLASKFGKHRNVPIVPEYSRSFT